MIALIDKRKKKEEERRFGHCYMKKGYCNR
jgi:hypothetical protein